MTVAGELAQGAAYINALAGRSLLVVSSEPQITWSASEWDVCKASACAAPWYRPYPGAPRQFTLTQPYEGCEIYVTGGVSGWQTQGHELFHCLGADHQRRGIMGGRPSRGVDRRLLVSLGYV